MAIAAPRWGMASLARAGHDVVVYDADGAQTLRRPSTITAVDSVAAACRRADAVLLSLPHEAAVRCLNFWKQKRPRRGGFQSRLPKCTTMSRLRQTQQRLNLIFQFHSLSKQLSKQIFFSKLFCTAHEVIVDITWQVFV